MRPSRFLATTAAAATFVFGATSAQASTTLTSAREERIVRQVTRCMFSAPMMRAATEILLLQEALQDTTPLPLGDLALIACASAASSADDTPRRILLGGQNLLPPTQDDINQAAAALLLPLVVLYEDVDAQNREQSSPTDPMTRDPRRFMPGDFSRPVPA